MFIIKVFNDLELVIRIRRCLNNDADEGEYLSIADMLTDLRTNPISTFNSTYNNPITDKVIISEFLRSFAILFPEKFFKYDYSGLSEVFFGSAVISIIEHSPAAAVFIKALKRHRKNYDMAGYAPSLLEAAAKSGNYEIFDNILPLVDSPADIAIIEIALYLYKEKKLDHLDKLFSGASREDIMKVCNQPIQYSYLFDIADIHLDFFYEMAVRYIPEISESENVSAAVADFMEELEIFSNLTTYNYLISKADNIKDNLEFMREHNMKFRDITSIINKESSKKYREMFEESILPLLDDKVYIDAAKADNLLLFNCSIRSEIVDLIGADRICIYFRGLEADEFAESEKEYKMYLTGLLKYGFDVRVSDNITKSELILTILNSPRILKYILSKNGFSETQLDDIIDLCIKNKKIDVLNIIRKYRESACHRSQLVG